MVLARSLVNASMVCEVEDEYVPVIWFQYHNSTAPTMVSQDQRSHWLMQNGQNLIIQDMNLERFLMTVFECHILSSPTSDGSIPVVNFTTVAIPGTSVLFLPNTDV